MCDCVVDGVHHDFCYRLPHNEQIRGEPFTCSNAVYVKRLGLLPTPDIRAEKHNASAEAIFVTALSDNHFSEGLTLIANIRSLWPQRKIIAFNLGLKHDSAARLRSLCHVELRSFPFHDYPDYVRNRRGVAKHGSKGSWRHEQAVTPTGGDNERCDLGELVSKERFAFLCGV
ncbi:hypothetical protein Q1695_005592 [Nippostrongylus brasiliensis]|nr:hypothetical protein Q1695_005592 [Nippostrongylus brasiliensis]